MAAAHHSAGLLRSINQIILAKGNPSTLMPVSPLMLRFVEDELSRAPALAERTAAATLTQLQQPAKPGTTAAAADRQVQQEVIEALRRGSSPFGHAFVDSLQSLVMADVQGVDNVSAAGTTTIAGGLQLMDETRVEADIEISRAAQWIDSAAEWELRELQTFTSTLIGQAHVSAESNPLRPAVYAQALWDACAAICPASAQRGLLLRTAAGVIAGQLKMAWAAACTRLESQGVTPSIYRTMVLATGSTAATPTPAAATPKAFEQALQQISALLQSRSVGAPQTNTSLAMPGSSAPGAPRAASLQGMAGSANANVPEGVDPHLVDLLSRVFEAVLSDDQIPTELRTVMARLQTSVLRLCLVDHTLLDSHQHPVWLLMNRIAQASQVWPQAGDPRSARLLAFCESLASDITSAPQQTTSVFTKGLVRLEAHLSQELRAQQERAEHSIAALTAAERRDALERAMSQQLAEQARQVRTTPRFREFLSRDWARVLTESMLRYGDNDERTVRALKTADDLLWSLHIPDHPQSRQRLLGLLPDLLKRLRAGMALVGLPEDRQQAVLDELMVVHTESLRPGERASTREATPQEIFQRLRDEGPSSAPPPSTQGFADSLIDVFSMDTVPAELMSDGDAPETGPDRPIDAMTPGSSCRWFLSGRWRTVQLLWRSDSLNYFVFAGETAGRTHSITRQALARLVTEGLVKPVSDTQLIQRAVHRVMRDLATSH